MGGICSRKRNQQVIEDDFHRGVSGRYCRSGSSKWLGARSLRSMANHSCGGGTCPSLMDLCINKIREVLVFFGLINCFLLFGVLLSFGT